VLVRLYVLLNQGMGAFLEISRLFFGKQREILILVGLHR
jgi:hypothetical protein